MRIKKFEVSLEGLPSSILRNVDGEDVLTIRFNTISGRKKKLELSNGDIVKTTDPIVIEAIQSYKVPKVALKHKPRDESEFQFSMHDHNDYSSVSPFTEVALNSTHQHVI